MVFLTIILFFACTYGLGFSATRLVRESENFLERNLMRMGIGLGSFITLGLLLNILRIPLDWRIFLILSLLLPIFYLFRSLKLISLANFRFKLTKYDLSILAMILIFFASFYMYSKGAFSYPWLEDDDSWGHAMGVKYVAVEKTIFAQKPLRYIDPYPASYDLVLGILLQTNDSVYWTLKFFNALIISLGIIFFFFFVNELLNSHRKALFSAFALASIPAFLSHFIWSISLNMPLYFISFYSAEKIKNGKKWLIVAAISIAAALTISPSHSVYFGLFFVIYYATKAIVEKKLLICHAAAGLFGLLASFLLWWLPAIIKHGVKGTLEGVGANLRFGLEFGVLNIAGTADRVYGLKDFLIAQKTNMINNPVGIGLVASLLLAVAFISLIFRYRLEISKNRIFILTAFMVFSALTLIFLSFAYQKYVYKWQASPLPRGSVPFFEFLSNQFFFVAVLLLMIFLLVSLAVISYKTPEFKDGWIVIALAWLIFSFYAVNAGPYYYKLTSFRAWSIFSIPLAILASEGLWFLISFFANFRIPKPVVVILVIIGIILTSTYQKYSVNTAQWPPGGFWTSNDEIKGYLWLKDNIPKNSNIFTFANNGPIIGMDMYTCHWCADVIDYQLKGINKTMEENYKWLKEKNYAYVLIDGQTLRRFGVNKTNEKIKEFTSFHDLKPVFSNNGIIIFKIL